MAISKVILDGGKYTVRHDNGVGLVALRHGEPWRDLCGDGLVLAMAQRIEELETALKNSDKLIEQLMPGIKHIVLQDYAFLNDTLIANRVAIKNGEAL